jgi:hypothetical protein
MPLYLRIISLLPAISAPTVVPAVVVSLIAIGNLPSC